MSLFWKVVHNMIPEGHFVCLTRGIELNSKFGPFASGNIGFIHL